MYSEKVPSGARIVLTVVSVLLCIFLFFSTAAAILIADVRVVTSRDALETIISQSLFSAPQPAPRPAPLAGGIAPRLSDSDLADQAQSAITDALYGLLEEQFGQQLPISPKALEELIEESTLPDFLSKKVAGVINDIYTGNMTTSITKAEVVALLQENRTLIENAFNIVLDDATIDAAGTWAEESDVMITVRQQVAELTGMEVPEDGSSADKEAGGSSSGEPNIVASALEGLRNITSVPALLGQIGICILLMGLLVLSHWGRPFAAMRTAGIPIMLAGLLFTIPVAASGLFAFFIPGFLGKLIAGILSMAGYVSISVFVLGLAFIIAGAILNRHFRKLYLAKKAGDGEKQEALPAAE